MTVITFSAVICNAVIALLSIVFYSKTSPNKYIRSYCLAKGVIDVLALALNRFGINNMPLFFILIWCEAYFILNFFLIRSQTISKVPRISLFIIVYFILLGTFFLFEDVFKFSVYSRIMEGLIIFMLCLIYFNDEFKHPKVANLFTDSAYWFVASFLTYYGSSWLILLGSTYFLSNKGNFVYIWDLQNILSILQNILIYIGFRNLK